MGCDIHGWIEIKKYKWTEQWYRCIDIDTFVERNYLFFSFVAGVRNYMKIIPISDCRGMPECVSSEVKEDYESWGSDAHSLTWFSWDEIPKYGMFQKLDYEDGKRTLIIELFKDDGIRGLFCTMNILSHIYGSENIRLVVWFDN